MLLASWNSTCKSGVGKTRKTHTFFMHFTVSSLLSEKKKKIKLNFKYFNSFACVIPNKVCINLASVKKQKGNTCRGKYRSCLNDLCWWVSLCVAVLKPISSFGLFICHLYWLVIRNRIALPLKLPLYEGRFWSSSTCMLWLVLMISHA